MNKTARIVDDNQSNRYLLKSLFEAADTETAEEKIALSLGADRFIIKPQDPETRFGR